MSTAFFAPNDSASPLYGIFGGDSSSSPSSPSASSSMADYISNYPALMQLQQQYAPQEAAMNVGLAQQYAGQYGQAMKTANDALNPETARLQPELANQAYQGMTAGLPDWAKKSYMSDMNARLGTNASSPIGADYASRGLISQQEDWKRYYQNMGLSLSGRMPLSQAQTPQTTNQLQGYTPSSVMGFNANIYGTQGGMYGQQQQATANRQGAMYGAAGTMLGAML